MTAFWILIAGIAIVVVGAELVVRGGARLAAILGVSPLVIGVTIVAIGTSTPELAVGIDAVLQGNGGLAVGNIAGANTLNLLFILGLSAAIRPLTLRTQTLRLDLPVIIAAAMLLLLLALDGELSRIDGVLMISAGIAYTAAVVRASRNETRAVRREYAEEFAVVERPNARTALWNVALLIAGFVIIALGADLLVDGAIDLARAFGVSDAFIGLTIVAIGTCMPELVTTIVATTRGERDIAIGNLLGSSVYNIVFILGVTALVPSSGIPVLPELLAIDLPVMVGATLICLPVFLSGRKVSRLEGVLFMSIYVAYLTMLVLTRT